jgi:hypothetical protein
MAIEGAKGHPSTRPQIYGLGCRDPDRRGQDSGLFTSGVLISSTLLPSPHPAVFAMTDADSLSDDYVASLLAKDAKESSIKYSALGMEAFLPSKY